MLLEEAAPVSCALVSSAAVCQRCAPVASESTARPSARRWYVDRTHSGSGRAMSTVRPTRKGWADGQLLTQEST